MELESPRAATIETQEPGESLKTKGAQDSISALKPNKFPLQPPYRASLSDRNEGWEWLVLNQETTAVICCIVVTLYCLSSVPGAPPWNMRWIECSGAFPLVSSSLSS